jgi:hypothetical protein
MLSATVLVLLSLCFGGLAGENVTFHEMADMSMGCYSAERGKKLATLVPIPGLKSSSRWKLEKFNI